jgi:hypothetical protein
MHPGLARLALQHRQACLRAVHQVLRKRLPRSCKGYMWHVCQLPDSLLYAEGCMSFGGFRYVLS